MEVPQERYGEAYYATGLGPDPYRRDDRWLAFFNRVAREIVLALAPRSVFDAGCALGMLVESFWDLGVEAHGIDVSEYAIANVRPDMRPYCRVGSVTAPPPGRYDLVTCIEVLEHVDADDAERAVAALSDLTDTILFSSTPTDFDEPTHVNVRPPIAWIRAFAAHGFRVDLRFDGTFLSPQAMLLRRAERYDDGLVEELYAHHVLIRSALIEREQRIGRLSGEADLARAQARSATEAERAERAAALAERDAALAERDAAVAQAHAQAQDAQAACAAADVRADAERTALLVVRSRLEDARAELRETAARAEALAVLLAQSEGRAGVAEERAALALARIGEPRAGSPARAKDRPGDPGPEAFAELARRYAALEQRYRRLVADDIALFEAEAARLSGY